MRRFVLILSVVVVSLLSCAKKPRKATPEDAASVQRTCSKHGDYDPTKGAEVMGALDQQLAQSVPEWRESLMNVCYFSQENIFIAYTTIPQSETQLRSGLCAAIRETGLAGNITPIYVHCEDGKRCTTCQQGNGGHR